MIALSCNNISKKFDKVKALNGVTIELEENKIYGLLGRNGAGKTTLLRTIGNELFADSGSIHVYGFEIPDNKNALEKICFIKDNMPYFADYNLNRAFKNASEAYKNWDMKYANHLANAFGLDMKKRYNTMSKGMKSILGIIIGLASRAPLTIFDEPYLGLDAAARQKFYDMLSNDFYKNPRTVIFSTHLIDEMSKLFEEIIILDKGVVTYRDEVEALREKAFYISGKKDLVDRFISNKRVIHEETIGSIKSAAMLFSKSIDRTDIIRNQLELTPIPLQKLFIYLTDNDGGELA